MSEEEEYPAVEMNDNQFDFNQDSGGHGLNEY